LLLANRWVWVLAILGYGYAYLNKPSSALNYIARVVYPSYLLHQSVLIVAAFSLSVLMLGLFLEAFWVTVITVSFCLVSYEILKRINILRPLVGISSETYEAEHSLFYKIFVLLGWALILALGYLILF
jgi:glucan biosynthesis protein C